MNKQKYLVILPTYNEAKNIRPIVTEVLGQGPDYDVLIVDDNSPDGTGQIGELLTQDYPGRVFVLHRPTKLGLGTAYLEGFTFGLERNYDYLFEMDADFSHKPQYLPELLSAAQVSGVATGSRYIAGGGVENWPKLRRLISKGGSLYSRTVLGLRVEDCTGGFKCFSRSTLQVLNLPMRAKTKGFGFQIEVNCLCEWSGFSVSEVPIIFPDRRLGKSKMNKKIFFEALFLVWKLRARKAEITEFRMEVYYSPNS